MRREPRNAGHFQVISATFERVHPAQPVTATTPDTDIVRLAGQNHRAEEQQEQRNPRATRMRVVFA